jgi:hypothetical protein
VNRWNFSQSRSGRVDFWSPALTLEGDREPNLKMNYGQSYTLKPGVDPEHALKSVYLTDIKFEQVQTMIQFFVQLLMNESGVSNANDDQAAGMQSSKLATGIVNIQQTGDELFKPLLADLQVPLSRLLNRQVDITLANLNPVEVFTFFEGDAMGVDKITPDDVRGMKYRAMIELTAHKDQQNLQAAAQAAALVEKFYMLPPQVQMHVADFYRQQIKSISPRADVDNVIQVVPVMPGALGGEPAPGGGSMEKLGDAGAGGSTPFPTQLTQAPAKTA